MIKLKANVDRIVLSCKMLRDLGSMTESKAVKRFLMAFLDRVQFGTTPDFSKEPDLQNLYRIWLKEFKRLNARNMA